MTEERQKMCHCGKPLHYSSPHTRKLVEDVIAAAGDEFVTVIVEGRSWRVQRHYIALHGLKGQEVEDLGFEEVKPPRPSEHV